jgi:hypothetical protein
MLADWFAALWDWVRAHEALFAWLGVLSIASLVLTVLLLPVLVARLPADYFVAPPAQRRPRALGGWLARIGKNVLAVVFVLAGIAMLVLPGQGLLTILIGLLLLDFPGKRALALRLVRRPALRAFLDRLRKRRGQPPLRVE